VNHKEYIEGLADWLDEWVCTMTADEETIITLRSIDKTLRIMLKLTEDEIRSHDDIWNKARAALDELAKDHAQ